MSSLFDEMMQESLEKDKIIADLEAKLAEKEKERHEEWKTGKEWKWEWQKVNKKLEKANQDKISFAVEQLEKVKELVEEKSMTQSPFGTQKIYASDVSGIIYNQIEQLTHQHEDKGE